MPQNLVRIVLTDDHEIVREAWKLLIETDPSLKVIAQCSSGAEAIEAAVTINPDIMLMDINMQPMNGFEATTEILQRNPEIKIIGVSINNQVSYARNMLEAGAKGYVTKNTSRGEMIIAIKSVYQGNIYICEEIRRKMNDEV
jgi:two-component system, NarL family, invasion response regulator UvrY